MKLKKSIACASLALLGPLAAATVHAASGTYEATVTRTTYGIPHIVAQDFGSLGYGFGYAFAEDNLCTMLEDFVTTRGERSRWFGADATVTYPAVPVTARNLDSDFFWKLMADAAAVQRFRAGINPEAWQMTAGYAAGFNRYLEELRSGRHPGRHAACAAAPWVQPVSEDDMVRRFIRLSLLASSSALITEVATAAPPAPSAAAPTNAELAARLARVPAGAQPFARLREKAIGSNAYALGPEATDTGVPMVFGNPHFPWTGTERLYMAQLTVPGRMNVQGASLYGTPIVLIGFNDQVAWSHTVSTAYRFTLYQLKLDRRDPTRYVQVGADGRRTVKAMQPVPLQVQVKRPDGTLGTESRTLYRSEYGPMVSISVNGVPVLGWTGGTAFTLRDANHENTRLINQYFAWNQAKSFDEFKALHASVLGTPWVNTVASGPGGGAYYGDVSVVPNVPDALAQACATTLSPIVGSLIPGLPLLDGSRADCAWQTDADAPAPGIFGAGNLPSLERPDWVANMNDSYWLSNAGAPFTRRYARIIGDYETARTLRTRQGILQIQRRLDGSDGRGAPFRFSLAQLQQTVLSSQVLSGELAQASVLNDLCRRGGRADVAQACTALRLWDRSATLDSVGVPVWQEFWANLAGSGADFWKTPFDPADPVNTPRDLDTRQPAVRQALAGAQQRLLDSGVELKAPWRQVQVSGIHPQTIPLFGAEGRMGTFTVTDSDPGSSQSRIVDGRIPVVYGNSFIHTTTWDEGGVRAEGFVSYSQSTDPASPYFADFTQAYSQQRWHRFPFRAEQIEAARIGRVQLSAPR